MLIQDMLIGRTFRIHNNLLAKRGKVSSMHYVCIGYDHRAGLAILALGSEATLWVHWSKLVVIHKP